MRLGNGRWENTTFNSRLQPTQIGLGSGATSQNLLKLDYTYNTSGNHDNNGNILSQMITVPTVGSSVGFTAVQDYTYDSLNRISDTVENITPVGGSSSQSWKQTFTYDRYGNRNFDEANTTTLPKNCGTSPNFTICAADKQIVNPSVNSSDNRLSTSDGYVFDDSGNTTKDAENRRFTYDAENKQVKVESLDGSGNPIAIIGEYTYDGDGKRIKKYVPSTEELTIFIYDAAGKLIGEYSTVSPPTQPKVAYLTNDHLGSPRINTDQNGAIIARHDYHPYGEEISMPQRTQNLGYAADTVRKQFTGYERDNETELDFAQARYYGPQHGRFNNPDPIMLTPERIVNPQQINLYVYAVNNPLYYSDPGGELPVRLGMQAANDLQRQINDIFNQLIDNPYQTELWEKVESLSTQLTAVEEGNKVVGAWLKELEASGESNGMQLSDFILTTEPVKDLSAAAQKAGVSTSTITNETTKWKSTDLVGTVIGGQIYLLQTSDVYQRTKDGGMKGTLVGDITEEDVARFGGSWLRHEDYHKSKKDPSEYQAYSHQRDVIDNINKSKSPFKNQKFFVNIKNGIQNEIKKRKISEGIK